MEHSAPGGHSTSRKGAADHESPHSAWSMYARFAASIILSLVAMYAFMFSEIAQLSHFRPALGMFWSTLAMVAAMGILMLVTMSNMLPNKRVNRMLLAGFGLLLVLSFAAARGEFLMGDDAFLNSMIPHHSAAIHMCREAAITDPEIVQICQGITESQSREIAEMERILQRRG